MSKKRVLVVFGTRPEAIKMCPVVNELKRHEGMVTIVAVTGQHREMLDQVLEVFSVIPDYDLSIMKPKQSLFDITSDVLNGMKNVLQSAEPDIVLVHGDTTTAFAAALAAYYFKIPVGHVEAGLRTNHIYSPFPEEFNREAVSLISAFHFAPTEQAGTNLIKEGKRPERIYVTGNTSIDALKTTIRDDYIHPDLQWALKPGGGSECSKLVLLTAHRRENLGQPMRNMFRAIQRVAEEHKDIKIIYPIHFNPEVRRTAKDVFEKCPNIRLIEPLDVIDFHNFMSRSYLILTDSGGIQEEAPALGKPVLVMRDTTERSEGVGAGTLKLVGTSEEKIYKEFTKLLTDQSKYEAMGKADNPYGDGTASSQIVSILSENI